MALFKLMQGSMGRICQLNQNSSVNGLRTVSRGMKDSKQSFFEPEELTSEPAPTTVTREKSNDQSFIYFSILTLLFCFVF